MRRVRAAYRGGLAAALGGTALALRVTALGRFRYDPTGVRRILVLRFGLLGDAILLTPALRFLRQHFPEAQLDVVATPVQLPVLGPLPFINRAIPWHAGDLTEPRAAIRAAAWRSAAGTIARLRAQRYDVAVSTYGQLGSAVALLSGAPARIGFEAEAFPGTLTTAIHGGRFDREWHDLVYSAAVALKTAYPDRSVSEMPWGDVPPVQLVVTEAARIRGRELLAGAAGKVAVLHPGATNGEAKRWPTPYWVELARRLAADGWCIALVGTAADAPVGRQIPREAAVNIDLLGRTSIQELFGVIERADVFVSGDSGPMHAAVALGRPTVSIHGPTDPVRHGPADLSHAVVVRQQLPCSPCYRLDRVAECPLGHTLCQWLVKPADVHAAVQALVGRSPRTKDEGRTTDAFGPSSFVLRRE